MRRPMSVAFFLLACVSTNLLSGPQASSESNPPPGSRGNADSIPFIGRSDPKGNPIRLARATGHVSNYTEEKIPPYRLPEPLAMANGNRVTSPEQWLKQRRPEILKFYRDQIYGSVPPNVPKVSWEVSQAEPGDREGAAIVKRAVGGKVGDKPDGPKMNMTIQLPAKPSGPETLESSAKAHNSSIRRLLDFGPG